MVPVTSAREYSIVLSHHTTIYRVLHRTHVTKIKVSPPPPVGGVRIMIGVCVEWVALCTLWLEIEQLAVANEHSVCVIHRAYSLCPYIFT